MAYTEYAGTDITLWPGPGGSGNADSRLKFANNTISKKVNVYAFTVDPIDSPFITADQLAGLQTGSIPAGLFIPEYQAPIDGTIVGVGGSVRPSSGFIYPRRET